MALSDTLVSITSKAPAVKNRVDILLNSIELDDLRTLETALNNPLIRAVDLTRALRKEYGNDAVKDSSVSEWRKKNITDVNGL